jgi:hypothetical protein
MRIGAVVLRTDSALASTGHHATSRVLDDLGFPCRFPTIEAALTDLLG